MYLFDIWISSVVKCGFKSFAHFIEFFKTYYSLVKVFNIKDANPSSDTYFINIFSQSVSPFSFSLECLLKGKVS